MRRTNGKAHKPRAATVSNANGSLELSSPRTTTSPCEGHGSPSSTDIVQHDIGIGRATAASVVQHPSDQAAEPTTGSTSHEEDTHNDSIRLMEDYYDSSEQVQDFSSSQQSSHTHESEMPAPQSELEFEAIDPPAGYTPLDFCPTMLSSKVTITACILYVALAAGMVLLAILPDAKVAHSITNDTFYFAIRYGPGILAAISSSLFKNIAQQVLRMLPYINMADPNGPRNARYTVLARYWPLLQYPHTWGTWINYILYFFGGTLIAYKAVLLEVVNRGTSWEVYIHTAVAIPLIAYYVIMAFYMLFLTVWMWNKSTGLRSDWDPQCLVDIIGLFAWFEGPLDDKSRMDEDYISPTIPDEYHKLAYRLGYWKVKSHSETLVVYGIKSCEARDKHGRPSSSFLHRQANTEKRVAQQARNKSVSPYLFSPWAHIWYRVCIMFLLAWLALIPLLFASGFIQHSFGILEDWSIHRLDHLANGTLFSVAPNITITPSGRGYFINGDEGNSQGTNPRVVRLIAAQFLLRFLPLFTLSFVASQMVVQDSYHRFMQPIYNMAQRPVLASNSLLLDYLTKSPFAVTSEALTNEHWKVFALSILGSAPDFLMLVPYGLLTLTSVGSTIVCQFSIVSATGTCILIVFWLITLLSCWPTERRRIPRPHMSLLDLWAIFRNSHIAADPSFATCEPHWTKEHLHGAIVHLNHQYLLGRCRDEQNKTRVGFDIHKLGSQASLTSWVDWARPRHVRFWKNKRGTQEGKDSTELDGQELGMLDRDHVQAD